MNFVNALNPRCKPALIRDLDGKSRTCIHFQNQWAAMTVDDDVDAKVAKPCNLVTTCRLFKDEIPLWNFQIRNQRSGIRVIFDDMTIEHAA